MYLTVVEGKHVITVEGIGNAKNPHPVQEVISRSPYLMIANRKDAR
jgi:aerobic-type carbon monoxide dehydrogenase small subunit (CoxS/CutS family)